METKLFFPYTWHEDDDDEHVTAIRIFGIDTENKNVCVKVTDFTPYVYLELPNDRKWNSTSINRLGNHIDKLCGHDENGKCKRQCNCSRPHKKSLSYKHKLYYANTVKKDDDNVRKKFPFLLLAFNKKSHAMQLSYKLKYPQNIPTIGRMTLKMHEQDAKSILQFVCIQDIETCGWTYIRGKRITSDKETLCDYEYHVKYKNFKKADKEDIPKPYVLSFDIEVNSTNPTRMPSAEIPGDKVFQISCVFSRQGDTEDKYEKYLLSLGNPSQSVMGSDTTVITYKTESHLLSGFTEFIKEKNPNIITGYNILGFDIPYMIERSKQTQCIRQFDKLGFRPHFHCNEKTIKWSSSAYGTQEFKFIDAEGRLFVDLLPLVKRDYKFDNYKLKTISTFFLGETKDPLSAKGIFKCYRIGMGDNGKWVGGTKAEKAFGVVGKYCVQDSALVLKLFDTLQTWVGLCEMAKTCNVPIFYLYTQGQQIKVFSQVYKFCMYNNFVVEKDGYEVKDNEQYTGAYVVQPVAGAYDRVVPFDFASLYPTTIIAYNIDYSTLVVDESIPDSECHVIEWEDHVGCDHDPLKHSRATKPKSIICDHESPKRYRFLKSPMGVIPTLLQNLLDARKKTKKEMKQAKKNADNTDDPEQKERWETRYTVLNKRQLAFKVSANSMYGAMGVKRGYLPFLPGAMCTTAKGRQSIELAGKTIQDRYKGQLVYGDTDSCYIHFPKLKTAQQCWDFCLEVEKELLDIFPPPMKLEFEEVIYWRFFILTKKRYMALSCGRDGKVEDKIMKKGVLLARRDNSLFIRKIYEEVIMKIFNKTNKFKVMDLIVDRLNELCSAKYNYKDFIVTKSVGDVTDYKIRELSRDPIKRMKRLQDLGIFYHNKDTYEKHMTKQEKYYTKYGKGQDFDSFIKNTKNKQTSEKLIKCGECEMCKKEYKMYQLKCLPAQVQLAERMRSRGMIVDAGSRIEYLVTTMGGLKGKQFEKIEDPEYQQQHSDVIKIDYLYYLKLASTPLDQALNVAYKLDNFVDKQYKLRVNKYKMLRQLEMIFDTKIVFE